MNQEEKEQPVETTTPTTLSSSDLAKKNKKLVMKLGLSAVGMFVFAVGILPPMYEVFCDLTGLNGKVDLTPASLPDSDSEKITQISKQNTDTDTENTKHQESVNERKVKILFIADTDSEIPWEFRPITRSIKVTPGEKAQVEFYVKNLDDKTWVGQTIPSITPAQGTGYFKKIECFCFVQQTLTAGEEANMPLIFYLDKEFPENLTELTLAYKLFPATNQNTDTASIIR